MKTSSEVHLQILCFLVNLYGISGQSALKVNPESLVHYPYGDSNEITASYSSGSLNLGLRLIGDLLEKNENAVLSPLNVYYALWLLQQGAVGDTELELRKVLGNFANFSRQILDLPDVDIASLAVLDTSVHVKPAYTAAIGNRVLSVNFTNDINARGEINRWVSFATKGFINNLLSNPLHPSTRAVVVSALYFDAKWITQFDPKLTKLGKFEVSDTEEIPVPLMVATGTFPYARDSTFSIIGLPYSTNGFTFYVVLPRASGPKALKSVIKGLTPDSFARTLAKMKEEFAIVTLPKITLENQFSLTDSLQKFGLHKMFDSRKANFTGMVEGNIEPNIFVSDIIHSVHMDLHESGTRAAAATATIITKGNNLLFRAARPFAFILRHYSGHVLFVGAVTRPS